MGFLSYLISGISLLRLATGIGRVSGHQAFVHVVVFMDSGDVIEKLPDGNSLQVGWQVREDFR